ncbi:uncharacterized protein LOC143476162 isoform X2 [Brachyhypopomus gauderio]|uniref:uncharacterized protein LOC143476162 isoform X2 n=1 Tax=Brachyhypopomus gauderio TaxID=698409 RepID=UPI004041D185
MSLDKDLEPTTRMNFIQQPEELKLTGNVSENWKRFKQSFELYSLAIGLETEERKVALLQTVAGRAALDVYNTFVFTEEEKDNYEVVMKKFEEYCTPRKNETYERYVFRNRLQKESESFEQYVTDLRLKSQSCNFEALRDSMIRDQIVIGVQDNKIRMQLLKETKLTLEKAIDICQASESAKAQLKSFSSKEIETVEVDSVQRAKPKATSRAKKRDAKPGQESRNCGRCGMQHAPKQCPAFGKKCRKCGGKNHFARNCFSKKKVQLVQKKSDSEEEPFFMDAIEGEINASSDEWIACLNENDTDVPLKLDTGAQFFQEPKVGDLIEIFRPVYQHWAIYVGDGYVIHLAPPSEGPYAGASSVMSVFYETGVVKKEKLSEVVGKDRYKINNLLDDKYKPHDISLILKQAHSLVGEKMPYSLISGNCEHFVTELRYGKPTSRQEPKVGDLIEIFRPVYQHWAIYVGDGYVIHLAPPYSQGSSQPRR